MESSYYYRGVKNRFERRPEDEGITLAGGISRLYRPRALDAAAHDDVMVTEPYEYEGKYMVEQTVPIIIDGKFAGIAGVDRALNDIDRFLSGLQHFQTGGFFLISRRGRIIASTIDPTLRAKPIETTPYAEILRASFEADGNGARQVELASDPVRGGKYYFASATIPTGGWTLLMGLSQDEVLGPVRRTARESMALSVIGTLLVLGILVALMGSIARRVEVAADAASRISDGDLTVHVDPRGGDETGMLLRAIDRMVQSLRALVGAVQHSSVRLVSTANEIAVAARRE